MGLEHVAQLKLSDGEPLVRGTALRIVADPRARVPITRVLTTDSESQVRVRAAETVEGFRDVASYLPVFAAVLQSDSAAQVRYMALHAVGTVKTCRPPWRSSAAALRAIPPKTSGRSPRR